MAAQASIVADEVVVDKEGISFDPSLKGTARVRTKREDTRESTRAPLAYAQGSLFNVPKVVTESDPEHQYGFIAYAHGSEINQNAIDSAVEKGWWPVKRSEHKALSQRYFNMNGDDPRADYVRKGGQILMKRLKTDHLAEMEFYKQQSEAQRNSYFNAQGQQGIAPVHTGFGEASSNYNRINFGG